MTTSTRTITEQCSSSHPLKVKVHFHMLESFFDSNLFPLKRNPLQNGVCFFCFPCQNGVCFFCFPCQNGVCFFCFPCQNGVSFFFFFASLDAEPLPGWDLLFTKRLTLGANYFPLRADLLQNDSRIKTDRVGSPEFLTLFSFKS